MEIIIILKKDLGSHVIGAERRTPEASKRVYYRWLYSQRDQVLGIPVVSSCMAPPSITAIGEGVLIVARAPAGLTHARARGTAQPNSDAGGVLLFVDPREANKRL